LLYTLLTYDKDKILAEEFCKNKGLYLLYK